MGLLFPCCGKGNGISFLSDASCSCGRGAVPTSSFASVGGVGFSEAGKLPFPFNNQYNSTSGKDFTIFITKSKLGLFLPDKICEMEERPTSILSAKPAADNS